eukprot:2432173-Rhodomonas_salina.1
MRLDYHSSGERRPIGRISQRPRWSLVQCHAARQYQPMGSGTAAKPRVKLINALLHERDDACQDTILLSAPALFQLCVGENRFKAQASGFPIQCYGHSFQRIGFRV